MAQDWQGLVDDEDCWVVKLGGSLFDLDALGDRLRSWLSRCVPRRTALVVGGGITADIVRDFDSRFHIGEVSAHWLALRALSFNSHLVSNLLAESTVVTTPAECMRCWEQARIPILDPFAFLIADEGQPDALPHCWDVTSDSVAARLAELIGAKVLILLKSCSPPQGSTPAHWAAAGIVDPWFPQAARRLPSVRIVNFRSISVECPEA